MKAGKATENENTGNDKARSFGGGGSSTVLDFLTVPGVAQVHVSSRMAFLENKGFNEMEISSALHLADEEIQENQIMPPPSPLTGPGAAVGEGRERDITTEEVAEGSHADDQSCGPSISSTNSWSHLMDGETQYTSPWGESSARQLQVQSQTLPLAPAAGSVRSRSPPPPGLRGPAQDDRGIGDLASMMAAVELAKVSSRNGSPFRVELEGCRLPHQHPLRSSSQQQQQQQETSRPVSSYVPVQYPLNEQQQQQKQQQQQMQQMQQMQHGGGVQGGFGLYPPHHHHYHYHHAPPHHRYHHGENGKMKEPKKERNTHK
eukprot:evm.model.NODE_51318_length_23478_cov_25.177656.3